MKSFQKKLLTKYLYYYNYQRRTLVNQQKENLRMNKKYNFKKYKDS